MHKERSCSIARDTRPSLCKVWYMLKEQERIIAREVVFSRMRCHRWPENERVLERLHTHISQKMEEHEDDLQSSPTPTPNRNLNLRNPDA